MRRHYRETQRKERGLANVARFYTIPLQVNHRVTVPMQVFVAASTLIPAGQLTRMTKEFHYLSKTALKILNGYKKVPNAIRQICDHF